MVNENRRYLVDRSGTPFFYHADTPWMIFTKLTEAEATGATTNAAANMRDLMRMERTPGRLSVTRCESAWHNAQESSSRRSVTV